MRVVVVVVTLIAAACGGSSPLRGIDVTLVPTSECTLTGQTTRDCEDETVLAQQSIEGRWILERGDDGTSASITTHEGRTLPGLLFNNDSSVLVAEGCNGEGGQCAFTRRRFTSTDLNNAGCRRFGELIAMGHFDPDDDKHFVGAFTDINGLDVTDAVDPEACGTPTVNELVFSVDGIVADDAVLARGAL
ncbi:MAG: hypothetical protein Q8O67_06945 [Deltaproteobacteria bacterium]|nr:hypothetical protein [Deltaproteobacteria bacterium]